jgi:methionyl-tRNA formyltransferase
VHQFKSLKAPEAVEAMKAAGADIGIMAFVLQFAPQEFVKIPKHGTDPVPPFAAAEVPRPVVDQLADLARREGDRPHHLPADRRPGRGRGDPAEEDAGRRERHLGSVYFDRLFPMGVQAMLEAADLVVSNKHKEVVQDEAQASYEGWFREAEAKIHWASHVDSIHDLIRGADPAPGAWTTLNGTKLQLFDSRKELVRTFGAVKGKIGEVVEAADGRLVITAQGGRIHAGKAKLGDGKKVTAADLISSGQIKPGTILGT